MSYEVLSDDDENESTPQNDYQEKEEANPLAQAEEENGAGNNTMEEKAPFSWKLVLGSIRQFLQDIYGAPMDWKEFTDEDCTGK